MDAAQNTTGDTVHVFERSGLGKAPFRFAGMIEQDLCYGEAILNRAENEQTGIRVTTKPGGSCDYCGAYIIQMYQIKSADGRTFKVGSDCVHKTDDAGLRKAVAKCERERRQAKTAKKRVEKTNRLAELLADESVTAKLAALPHPTAYMDEKGLTMLDYATFMNERAGTAGKTATIKKIEATLT